MTSQPKLPAHQVESAGRAEEETSRAGDIPASLLPSDESEYQELEKKLVRKIDWRLMPVLVVMIVLK